MGSPDWFVLDEYWEGWHSDDTFVDDLVDLIDARSEMLALVELMLAVHAGELTRHESRRLRSMRRCLRRFMR